VGRFDLAAVLFGLALFVATYGMINAAWLRVTRIDIRLPNLPMAWQGRTVALVTDLHLGHIAGPGFLRRVIARLRSLQPDAVLIGGDMFDGTTVKLDELVAPWGGYSAPRGVYYVTGNHDEFAERTIYLDAVRRTGVRVLNNEKVVVDGLQIVGVHDAEAGDAAVLRGILRGEGLDPRQPSILLMHRPENLAVAEEEGISLQLSGHTHRGQIWPWTLLVSRIYGRFAYGLQRLNQLQVYTSSGAGAWGPPLRVGTRAEIVLIRLV
jgi:predicted MPP superfamily phosphohydrolase